METDFTWWTGPKKPKLPQELREFIKHKAHEAETWETLDARPNVSVIGPQMDWTPINRFEKYSDVIQRKPDSEPGGIVSELVASGEWEVINVLKNLVILGKLKDESR